MRHLGIDYGTKRVGVAISDENNRIAFPKTVLEAGPGLVERLRGIIEEHGVTDVVLGESKDFAGEYNPVMGEAFRFKSDLEAACGVAVRLEPEFLTSAQAGRQGETPMLDASAAAIILQSYLDKINNNPEEHDKDR